MVTRSIFAPIFAPVHRPIVGLDYWQRRAFDVLSLFKSGEQGVWYDPSDTTTLFQDSAGTTPVTASGQPVGLMLDKSGRGNHATQPTAASRPIYRRGDSRGVVNLLTWSEAFDNAGWIKTAVTVTPNAFAAPDGTLTAEHVVGTTSGGFLVRPPSSVAVLPNTVYTFSLYGRLATGAPVGVGVVTDNGVAFLGTNQVISNTGGYTRVTITFNSGAETFVRPIVGTAVDGRLTPSNAVYIWGAQINLGPTALPYQRNDSHLGGVATGASTDLHWLETDGVDDGMVTGNIDFTGTDKVSVFAGVRKLSDAGTAMVAELSANISSSNGAFHIATSVGGASYQFTSKGTNSSSALTEATFPAPISNVLTGVGNIVAVLSPMRVNGIQTGSISANQGTGNYGNYPLYLFRRGGASLPFNGWFYGLAITGRLTTGAETVATERYLAAKSGVAL